MSDISNLTDKTIVTALKDIATIFENSEDSEHFTNIITTLKIAAERIDILTDTVEDYYSEFLEEYGEYEGDDLTQH